LNVHGSPTLGVTTTRRASWPSPPRRPPRRRNVLLELAADGPRVKLTDFGLARAADDASLTRSGVVAGTPMYMAPEETVDQRADLFSLGSVFYVMLSGRPPFRATTMLGVLKRVAEDTPRPIREVIPEVPQWLCDVIGKLPAKKPEETRLTGGRQPTAGSPVGDQERPQAALKEKPAEGCVSLFDGKSLAGWFVESGDKDHFQVKDGAIVVTGRGLRTQNFLRASSQTVKPELDRSCSSRTGSIWSKTQGS
jgi:serine/threonine protein kinase